MEEIALDSGHPIVCQDYADACLEAKDIGGYALYLQKAADAGLKSSITKLECFKAKMKIIQNK